MLIPLVLSLVSALAVFLLFLGLTADQPLTLTTFLARPRERVRRSFADFLAGAGLPDVAPSQFVGASVLAGLVCAAIAQLVLGWPLVALLAFALGLALPFGYFARRWEVRRARIEQELADAMDQLTAAVRAGLSLTEALQGLARYGPKGLRAEWDALLRDQRLLGLGPALQAMRERLADPTVDLLLVSLALADATGGQSLSRVLDQLSHTVRARVRLRAAVRAEQDRHRLSAQVVAALPIILLVIVRATNPDYLAVYNTLLGQLVIGIAVALTALGYVLMLYLARLPQEPRVFR